MSSMKMSYIRKQKPAKNAWLNPHKCLICGEALDLVTHAHAENHGYKTRDALIQSGNVQQIHETWRESYAIFAKVYARTQPGHY